MTDNSEIPIAQTSRGRIGGDLFYMWASDNGFSKIELYIWAHDFEDAFYELVEHLDKHAPGLLVSHDEFRDLLNEAAERFGFRDFKDAQTKLGSADDQSYEAGTDIDEIVQAAETDLTLIGTSLNHGNYIASANWCGDEMEPSDPHYQQVLARSVAAKVGSND